MRGDGRVRQEIGTKKSVHSNDLVSRVCTLRKIHMPRFGLYLPQPIDEPGIIEAREGVLRKVLSTECLAVSAIATVQRIVIGTVWAFNSKSQVSGHR